MLPDFLLPRFRPGARAVSLCALLTGLLLTACGGSGTSDMPSTAVADTRTSPPATSALAMASPPGEASAADPLPQQEASAAAVAALEGPGLLPEPASTVDSGPAGSRVVRAVGALADGGHAVVWAAPLAGAQAPAWTLWVQAYDRGGRKSGAAAMLDIGAHVQSARNASALVLPEGGVAVGYLASQQVDPNDPGTVDTSAYTARFSLDGSVRYGPRRLDTLVFDKFSPRSNRLAGPVAMALGQDGSYLVGWRFDAGSYFGRQPTFRIQRLAADTEPLGWIQHLDRHDLAGDLPGDLLAHDRLRLTMLDEGGWAASFADTYQDLGLIGRVVQNDVARPLGIPPFGTLAPGAWLLDLRKHGSVLFADRQGTQPGIPLSPYSMHFNRQGREQDAVRPLPAIPTTAAALRGGDYVAIWRAGASRLDAQRFTPRGEAVGSVFAINATPGADTEPEASGLRHGGMALAWVETSGTSSRVVTQRFLERDAP